MACMRACPACVFLPCDSHVCKGQQVPMITAHSALLYPLLPLISPFPFQTHSFPLRPNVR